MAMPFTLPIIRLEPKNYVDDCYFCSISVPGFSGKNKHRIVYQNLNSAMTPILHDENLPVPEPTANGLAFLNKWNVKIVLHLQPFTTFMMVNTSQRRGLKNRNNLLGRN
jgi:hypothetical protein